MFLQICSSMNTTRTCGMSSEKLMQSFSEIYEGKNEIQTQNDESGSKFRQRRQENNEFLTEHEGELEPYYAADGTPTNRRQFSQLRKTGKGLMKMLRRINFLGRPFLRPEGSQDRAICKPCENKRNGCFYFYMGTYGLCGGAW